MPRLQRDPTTKRFRRRNGRMLPEYRNCCCGSGSGSGGSCACQCYGSVDGAFVPIARSHGPYLDLVVSNGNNSPKNGECIACCPGQIPCSCHSSIWTNVGQFGGTYRLPMAWACMFCGRNNAPVCAYHASFAGAGGTIKYWLGESLDCGQSFVCDDSGKPSQPSPDIILSGLDIWAFVWPNTDPFFIPPTYGTTIVQVIITTLTTATVGGSGFNLFDNNPYDGNSAIGCGGSPTLTNTQTYPCDATGNANLPPPQIGGSVTVLDDAVTDC